MSRKRPRVLPNEADAERLERTDPCWCLSGQRYSECHWQEDQQTGGAALLRPINTLLEELSLLLRGDGGVNRQQLEQAVTLAALGWNLSRMDEDARKAELDRVVSEASVPDGQEEGFRKMLSQVAAKARDLAPRDPRSVTQAMVVSTGRGRFGIQAQTSMPDVN